MKSAAERESPIGSFFRWWSEELRIMAPAPAPRAATKQAMFVLHWDTDGVSVTQIGRGRAQELGFLRLPGQQAASSAGRATRRGPGQDLARLLSKAQIPIVLRFARRHGIVAQDTLPASAEPHLQSIVAHRLDVLTPLTAERACFAHEILARREDGQLEVGVYVIPRDLVERALTRLRQAGIEVQAADLAVGEPSAPVTMNLLGGPLPGARRRSMALMAVPVAVIALAVGAAWSWAEIDEHGRLLDRERDVLASLQAELADVPEIQGRVETLRNEAAMISERVSSLPSPIVVLEVLSRLLPDGVWLTGLSLQGDTLSITGFAREPARLIPLLEQSPHFAEVAFRAPSTQTTVRVADGRDMSLERFSLAARVEQLWEP